MKHQNQQDLNSNRWTAIHSELALNLESSSHHTSVTTISSNPYSYIILFIKEENSQSKSLLTQARQSRG